MALRRSRALAAAVVGCLAASIMVIGAAQARASEVAVGLKSQA
jgi:hypothetical protein